MSSETSQSAKVTFAGALPPPVTGMTAMSAVILEALSQYGPVHCDNWSRNKTIGGWRWKLVRGWGMIKTLLGLIRRGRVRGGVFYLPVSSGLGLFKDIALVSTAKLLGYRIVIHHHTYAYIYKRDWRVAILNRLVGSSGAQVVHCDLMHRDFSNAYDARGEFLTVPPTIVSQQLPAVASQPHSDFRLGFLSNLSLAKGLDDAIATFELLAASGTPVQLLLAGPCRGTEERKLIDAAAARWPERVHYRGPVYDEAKASFFAGIDVFIFPTRNESWGIVLSEALTAGCPVIARSRGCIPWIVRDHCGVVIDAELDFAPIAAQQIQNWIDSPATHESARKAARIRSQELELDADRELPEFARRMFAFADPRGDCKHERVNGLRLSSSG